MYRQKVDISIAHGRMIAYKNVNEEKYEAKNADNCALRQSILNE